MGRKQAKKRKTHKPRNWAKLYAPVVRVAKLAVAVAVVGTTYELSARLLDRPIEAITVDGPFQRVSALQIEEAINGELGDGFLSADLDEIRDRVAALPWIDQASVARRWPATIEIRVTEQVPAACWGERGLLNTRGELFVTDARHVPAELPRLSGPEGRSAEVARTYLELRDRLIPMGLDLRRVHMDARGAWEVTLQNGVAVRLGRRDVMDRIELFLDVVADLVSSREAEIDFVDMRYSNGFTIGWSGADAPPALATGGVRTEMLADTSASSHREGRAE
jgi:cell division protein FtsQ